MSDERPIDVWPETIADYVRDHRGNPFSVDTRRALGRRLAGELLAQELGIYVGPYSDRSILVVADWQARLTHALQARAWATESHA